MSIGSSGRIVIEVEPELKRELYAYLTRDGLTLKEWFLQEARSYLATTNQLSLGLQNGAVEVASRPRAIKND
jgi:hypothetical protein